MAVIDPLERKLAKLTSMHWWETLVANTSVEFFKNLKWDILPIIFLAFLENINLVCFLKAKDKGALFEE